MNSGHRPKELQGAPNRNTKVSSYTLRPSDIELVEWIAAYFRINKSEAVRTSIRSFAAHLGYLESMK